MKNHTGPQYEPFPEAGQYIVNCYEATNWDGKKEIRAHINAKDVHEKIVRCGDCKYYNDHEWVIATDVTDVCHFWHSEPTKVEPDGFCKWGEPKEDEAAGDVRHHRAQTIEDVLREFADRVCSSDHIVKDGKYRGIEDDDLLAEYAAKLRLAGDE